MDLMEGVEEIPGVVLAEGLTWEWESFSDFLDALERRPRAIDVAAQVAHLPLRVYVMGDRAVRLEAARPEDIAEMRRVGLLSHPTTGIAPCCARAASGQMTGEAAAVPSPAMKSRRRISHPLKLTLDSLSRSPGEIELSRGPPLGG
jgi:N-acyl-D-aspartate/D-glutamate deacylase